jgi:RHS repeat-associated protein
MQVADYDGDGNRVKTVVGSTTTAFVGNILEWTGSTTTMKKYYYSNGQRVAMRQGSSTLYYLLTDHLGSTAITATTSGSKLAELRYYPWGGVRYTYGTTPTDYRFTGQQEVASIGLYFFKARFYDASLGRFISPDTIIPNPSDPVSYDRFAYVRNNPMRYTDPTGHWYYDPGCDCMVDNGEPEYQFEENLSYYRYVRPIDLSNTEVFVKRAEDQVIGWRVEGSIPRWDFNLDFVYFSGEQQFQLFGSIAPQLNPFTQLDYTTGLLYGENLPTPSSYAGPSVVNGGDIPLPIFGLLIETDITYSANPNGNGSIPMVAYFGIGPINPSAGAYSNPSYSIDLIQFVSIISETILDLFR